MAYSISASGPKESVLASLRKLTGPVELDQVDKVLADNGAKMPDPTPTADHQDFVDAKARAIAFVERCKDGATVHVSVSGHRLDDGAKIHETTSLISE